MLREIRVENLALIERANVQFQSGLNVLSGETGAGKSMVIDAVSLLLGARASKNLIRKDAEKCYVEGVFITPFSSEINDILNEAGIENTGEIILSRDINVNGNSVCRINMRNVPLSFFRQIGGRLINIHGQMEHISLLECDNQMTLLDSFGGENVLATLERTSEAFSKYKACEKAYNDFINEQNRLLERKDFLEYQLREIDQAELKEGELDELQTKVNRLKNAEKISKRAMQAYQDIAGKGDYSPIDSIMEARDSVNSLLKYDSSLEEVANQIKEAYFILEDAKSTLSSYYNSVKYESNSFELDKLEDRVYRIKEICRKYGGDIKKVLELAEKNREELDRLENKDFYIKKAKDDMDNALKEYFDVAKILHNKRADVAGVLASKITDELHQLEMPNAEFSIALNEVPPTKDGIDEVVFLIKSNVGEDFLPISEIASGGEISRIMLAVKVILAHVDQVSTLIFDEIDSGLGGVALAAVARKLVEVSASTQSICVTHAPVIAAYSENHLKVEKHVENERTITNISLLEGENRLLEICRMIAGDKVTEATKEQANQMIEAGKAVLKAKRGE